MIIEELPQTFIENVRKFIIDGSDDQEYCEDMKTASRDVLIEELACSYLDISEDDLLTICELCFK